MADPSSDDYFQDSFDLNEDDLALLDETEAKFGLTIAQASARVERSVSPPPAKKFRGWISPTNPTFSPPQAPTAALEALSYNAADKDRSMDTALEGNVSLWLNGTQGMEKSMQKLSFGGEAVGLISQKSNKPTPRSTPSSNSTRNVTVAVAPSRALRPLPPSNKSAVARPSTPTSTVSSQTLPQDARPTKNNAVSTVAAEAENTDIKEELASLKAQLEKVNRDYILAQEALKRAEVARYAKDGEVSILRKTLEKASEQHAMDLAKVREAKEKADAEQARLKKEMKEQIERLRTEFAFKQHEIETSARKPTWSSKSKRASFGPSPSPIPVHPEMRNWSSGTQSGPSGWNSQSHTPSKRRTSTERGKSPKPLAKHRQVVPELKFPGFDNSFVPTSPVKSPTRRRSMPSGLETSPLKGKGKAPARSQEPSNALFSPVKMASQMFSRSPKPREDVFPTDDNIQDFDLDLDVSSNRQRRSGKDPGRGSSPGHDVPDSSSFMGSEFLEESEQEQMEIDQTFEGIDWRDELHFLLFTHVCKTSKTISFHYLLSTSLDPHFEYVEQYHNACSTILETLGSKGKYSLEKLMHLVSNGLVRMGTILWKIKYLAHLTVLWDLMRSVMIYIPSFTPQALLSAIDFEGQSWSAMTIACDISRESIKLKGGSEGKEEILRSFLHSTLSFMEAIAWTIPETFSANLALLPRTDRSLLSLLDQKQFADVLSHTFRMLVVFATHVSLFRHFVAAPDLDQFEKPLPTPRCEPGRIPLLERLSSFLVDSSTLPRDTVDRDLVAILNFFSLINQANLEGRAALLKSNTLVPSLVYHLFNLSSLIWEEDEQTMHNQDVARRVVSQMRHSLDLLHQLLFPDVPVSKELDELNTDFDLRYKLHTAPHVVFNGLAHMFTVMIGRLSYADPPDWLSIDMHSDIERMTEPARDLMDLIIEGPEGDSVWAAYQDAEAESITEEDEEEMEARMLDEDELIE